MTTPALAFNKRGMGRHYRNPQDGDEVPSVTNVIGILDKPAIPRWAARTVAERAWELRHSLDGLGQDEAIDVLKGAPWRGSKRAADRGTSVHEYLEAAADGRELPELTGDAARYRGAADEFLTVYEPQFMHTELTVFGDGYAGTADFVATINWHGRRVRVLGDYKTSKRLYREVALQLAAIRHADVTADGDPVPTVDGCVGVLLTPQGCEVREVDAGAEAFQAFQACLAAWRWRHLPDPVGEVVVPSSVVAA